MVSMIEDEYFHENMLEIPHEYIVTNCYPDKAGKTNNFIVLSSKVWVKVKRPYSNELLSRQSREN